MLFRVNIHSWKKKRKKYPELAFKFECGPGRPTETYREPGWLTEWASEARAANSMRSHYHPLCHLSLSSKWQEIGGCCRGDGVAPSGIVCIIKCDFLCLTLEGIRIGVIFCSLPLFYSFFFCSISLTIHLCCFKCFLFLPLIPSCFWGVCP